MGRVVREGTQVYVSFYLKTDGSPKEKWVECVKGRTPELEPFRYKFVQKVEEKKN